MIASISSCDVCRICLQQNIKRIPLFGSVDNDYKTKLWESAGVDIAINDGLPQSICQICAEETTMAYKFVTKCRESDKTLRTILPIRKCTQPELPFAVQIPNCIIKSEPENSPIDFSSISANDVTNDALIERTPKKEHKSKKLRKPKGKLMKTQKINKILLKLKARPIKNEDEYTSHSNCTKLRNDTKSITKNNVKIKAYKCLTCKKTFSSKGNMLVHVRTVHLKEAICRTFTCETCGKQCTRQNELVAHLRIHTGEKPYSCTHCTKSFTQLATLITHVRTHTGEKPYSCKICNKKFGGLSNLNKHLLVHSSDKLFNCNICNKAFKSKDNVTKHLLTHTQPKSIVCDLCCDAFSTKGNLKLHIMRIHSEKSGYCSICNKMESNLKNHTKSHTDEASYQCNICMKFFNLKRNLANHIKKHDSDGEYKCTLENCSRAFSIKSMLEYHQMKHHTNEKPHTCITCNRCFCRMTDLSRHVNLKHKNENKY